MGLTCSKLEGHTVGFDCFGEGILLDLAFDIVAFSEGDGILRIAVVATRPALNGQSLAELLCTMSTFAAHNEDMRKAFHGQAYGR